MENRRFYLVEVWQVQAMLLGRVTASDAVATFHEWGLRAPKVEYAVTFWRVHSVKLGTGAGGHCGRIGGETGCSIA